MPIYDLTYRGWKGERTKTPAWFPILENTIKLAFRNKLLANLYRACALPPLIASVFLYIQYSIRATQMGSGPRFANVEFFGLRQYVSFLSAQGIIAIAVAGVVGSQAIAADRRGNALESLFSRAITRRDYLLGRFLGLFTLVLGATLIPGFIIWTSDLSFSLDSGQFVKTLSYPVRITAWAVMLSTSASLLILAFSAMIRRGWLAIAAFAAFSLLSTSVMNAVAAAIRRQSETASEFMRGFSYFDALYAVEGWIFGISKTELNIRVSLVSSVAWLVFLAILSIVILLRRVRPIEVVS
ncbi:MAG: ABC transporter permease subunit [Planctomycetota bacterium]